MRQRVAWHLLGLATAFLAAGVAGAGVQGRQTVCWLGTESWQLTEKDGEVCLIEAPWDSSKAGHYEWHVSAPTIRGQEGKFLGGDPEGRRPSVHLLADKGPTTRWVFEIVSTLQPRPGEGDDRRFRKGPSGSTFRVKMAEGRFKGWYLAAEEPPAEPKGREGEGPAPRRLELVRDVKQATVFTYIESNYFIKG